MQNETKQCHPMIWTLLAMARTNQVTQKCSKNSVEDDSIACMCYTTRWLPQRKVHETRGISQLGGSHALHSSRKQGNLVPTEGINPSIEGYCNTYLVF
jgi:hypothetical protein